MGVTYWGYAYASPEALEQMPDAIKDDLEHWQLVASNNRGNWWKLVGEPATYNAMGMLTGMDKPYHDGYTCIYVDDSGSHFAPTFGSRWTRFIDAEQEVMRVERAMNKIHNPVQVELTVNAAAWHQMGATVSRSVKEQYEKDGDIMAVVTAILNAEDQWTGDWEHDDFDAEDAVFDGGEEE
jgi:hypothetical protein